MTTTSWFKREATENERAQLVEFRLGAVPDESPTREYCNDGASDAGWIWRCTLAPGHGGDRLDFRQS